MESVHKLPSKEIIRNVHVLMELHSIFSTLEDFYGKWFTEDDVKSTFHKKSPAFQLCKYVDKIQEEHIFPWVFGLSRDQVKLKISTLMSDLAPEVEEHVHASTTKSISFKVVATDLQDILWMRNTRQVDGGEVLKHT